MRLFRQPTHYDWSGLISDVNKALDELFLLRLDAV